MLPWVEPGLRSKLKLHQNPEGGTPMVLAAALVLAVIAGSCGVVVLLKWAVKKSDWQTTK